MKKLGVRYVLIMLCMISFAGCGLTDWGSRVPSREGLPDAQVWPVNAYYLFSEAHLNLKKGNLDRAIELMQQALVHDPESVYLKRELAGFWLMKKDPTAAMRLLDEILVNHPDDIDTLILAGRIHQNINQPAAAMDAFARVIALDPSQQNIYLQLGDMHMEREQWDQAEQVYKQLVKYFPGSYAGYFFLGRISAINGDGKAARLTLKKPWPLSLNW
jgi:tetratricopeptide (TPR) repeat protein